MSEWNKRWVFWGFSSRTGPKTFVLKVPTLGAHTKKYIFRCPSQKERKMYGSQSHPKFGLHILGFFKLRIASQKLRGQGKLIRVNQTSTCWAQAACDIPKRYILNGQNQICWCSSILVDANLLAWPLIDPPAQVDIF